MTNSHARIKGMLAGQLILLLIQFLIGMVLNLWITLPVVHPGAHPKNYFAGLVQGIAWALVHANGFLQLHIVLGIVLWVMSIILVTWVIRLRSRGLVIATILAWIGLTGAGFNGGSFLIEGGLSISSFLMSVGMALCACSYVWAWGAIIRIQAQQRRA